MAPSVPQGLLQIRPRLDISRDHVLAQLLLQTKYLCALSLNSYVEALIPNMMVFGSGTLERSLGVFGNKMDKYKLSGSRVRCIGL